MGCQDDISLVLLIVADCSGAQPADSTIQFGLNDTIQTGAGDPSFFALFCGAGAGLGRRCGGGRGALVWARGGCRHVAVGMLAWICAEDPRFASVAAHILLLCTVSRNCLETLCVLSWCYLADSYRLVCYLGAILVLSLVLS